MTINNSTVLFTVAEVQFACECREEGRENAVSIRGQKYKETVMRDKNWVSTSLMTTQCSSTIAIVYKSRTFALHQVGDYLLGGFLEKGGGRLPSHYFIFFISFYLFL